MKLLFTNFGGVWDMAAGRRSLAALNLQTVQLCSSKSEAGFPASPLITPRHVDTYRPARVVCGSSEMVEKAHRERLLEQSYTALSLGRKTQGSKRKLNFDAEVHPVTANAAGEPAKGLLTSIVKQEPLEEKLAIPSLTERPRKRTLRRSTTSVHSTNQKEALQRVESRGKRKRFTSVPSARQWLPGKVPKIERAQEAIDCARTVKEEVVESEDTRDARPYTQLVVVTGNPWKKKRARSPSVVRSTESVAEVACAAPGLAVYNGPYPNFARPCPDECREVAERLYKLHRSALESYSDRQKCSSPTTDNTPVLRLSCNSDALPLGTGGRSSELSIKSESGASDGKTQDCRLVYSPEQQLTISSASSDKAIVGCVCFLERSVLDSLVGTILSQNTNDTNSSRAFHNLKRTFSTWEKVQRAEPDAVADAIRCAGLAAKKVGFIQSILTTLLQERGKISLEHLWNMSEADIKEELGRFKGVGPKTVACVLMFHLKRDEFPVDTHVFRISKMLGWVPAESDRENTYLHLNQRIPNNLKFDLHCMFVTHGRSCPNCAAGGRPRQKTEGPCPLLNWSAKYLARSRAS